MNKSEIAARVAGRTGLGKPVAREVVDAVFDVMAEALAAGEEVRLVGFGVFEVKNRPARTWRNPGNGQWMRIKAFRVPTFRAGMPLRDAVKAQGGWS